jgi:hypothetical protein
MTYQVEIEFKGNRQRIISDSYNALKPLSPLNEAEFLGLRPGDKVVYWGPPILGGIPSRRYRGEFVRFQTENEVLSELLEEHTRLKKKRTWGDLTALWVAHDTRDAIMDFHWTLVRTHRDRSLAACGLDWLEPEQVLLPQVHPG